MFKLFTCYTCNTCHTFKSCPTLLLSLFLLGVVVQIFTGVHLHHHTLFAHITKKPKSLGIVTSELRGFWGSFRYLYDNICYLLDNIYYYPRHPRFLTVELRFVELSFIFCPICYRFYFPDWFTWLLLQNAQLLHKPIEQLLHKPISVIGVVSVTFMHGIKR